MQTRSLQAACVTARGDVKIGRVAHVAHDAGQFPYQSPQYAESIAMLFLFGNVGIAGRIDVFALFSSGFRCPRFCPRCPRF